MNKTFLPQMASTRDIQRDFKSIRDRAIKNGPVVILSQQKADVALVKIELLDELERLRQQQMEWEMEQALEAIRVARKEEKAGKLLKGNLRNLVEKI